MLQSLKILSPQLSHVRYFSDGAPFQYKNFKNLTNLIHHQDDHQLGAEWHFFATSYGTSPCDGIGNTVKCLVTQSSFQNNHVLNVDLIYDLCANNIPGIIFITINTYDVQNYIANFSLKERYSSADSFQGSRIYHCFITTTNGFEMRLISADKDALNVSISKIQPPSNITNFMPGMHVASIYDDDWFVGNVVKISDQYNEIHVKFMKKMENAFRWPTEDDQCWVPLFNYLGYVDSLLTQGNRARNYFKYRA